MKLTNQKYLKLIAQVIIIGLALWILAPQVSELVRNRQTISSLSLGWLVAGLAIFLLSNIFAAYVYQYLSPKKLSFKKNVQVQLATGFTNRLLPAGIGGISTNSLFLMRAGYKRPQAVSIALANNLVGFLAFGLVLVASGALLPSSLSSIFSDTSPIYLWATAGVVIVALAVTMFSEKFRELIQKNLVLGISVLKDTLARPLHLILALLSSAGIAFCFVGALYCCLRGAGIVLSPNELMLVFLASAIATSASPTPGGLGAAEVSMMLALDKLSIAGPPALAGVIAFRLITYWLPILPGYLFFRIVGAKRYI